MVNNQELALEAIRKKLVGKRLSYREYYAIIDNIVHGEINDVLIAYFIAAGFAKKLPLKELYYLTQAMVDTGEKLKFSGIVADKHCIGGIPGYRTTLIVVPIIAAAGLKIPKTSSRAITSPAGTADVMETLAKVSFSPQQIKQIISQVGGCMVWGGSVHLAPADDKIIRVEKVISFESYDKVVASIMAKKIAVGATHLVIDLPYGRETKVRTLRSAFSLERKLKYIAQKFKIKMKIERLLVNGPIGRGIGPVLEARECLRILQQKENRSLDLETRALKLAGSLLELCGQKKEKARELLINGQAFKKMKEIIAAQGGNPNIDSEDLEPGEIKEEVKSDKSGWIKKIENKAIIFLCRLLGTPEDKKAGLYLEKQIGEKVEKGEDLFYLYSSDKMRLLKAKEELKKGLEVFKIK